MRFLRPIALSMVMLATLGNTAYAGNGKKMKLIEHVCTAACKDGKHMYAHGEKGHVCGPECKKSMKKM
jgi:hypothetical protein